MKWLSPFSVMVALCGAAAAAANEAPRLEPVGGPYTVALPLDGKKGSPSFNVSGIACRPADGDARTCLMIDDESRQAQFVTIRGRAIVPGTLVKLVGKKPSGSTLGTPPEPTCPSGVAKSTDLDGEAVAYAAPYFYVSGSHGCARKKGTFQLSSFVLARIEVGHGAEEVMDVETTYRLSDALRSDPSLLFMNDLMLRNGLNLEGLAVVGDRLYAGLRAPSLHGNAFLVAVSAKNLFAPGSTPLHPATADGIIALRLGPDTGIRDLAPLPNGRLLVLAGPAQDQANVPYSLFVAEPRNGGYLEKIGVLAPLPGPDAVGKAEAITVLGPTRCSSSSILCRTAVRESTGSGSTDICHATTSRTPRARRGSRRRMSVGRRATHPSVGGKPGFAQWKKIALPRPTRRGARL